VVLLPIEGQAYEYEAFTGFQIDNQQQYIAYGALRATLSQPNWPVEPFFQVFWFREEFFDRSQGQLLKSQLNQVVPAVGFKKYFEKLEVQFSAGPALRQAREESVFRDEAGTLIKEKETINKIGYAVSGYGSYSTDAETFEGLLTYTNLEDFFWGRLRWTRYAFETEGGTPINPGLELLALGNSQFKQGMVGALVGTEVGKVEILLKGGYQNNSTFYSGGYAGIELSVRF
jgi:hypothetical protein